MNPSVKSLFALYVSWTRWSDSDMRRLRSLKPLYLSVLSPFALRSVSVARSARLSHALFFPSPFPQARASSFRFQAEPLKEKKRKSKLHWWLARIPVMMLSVAFLKHWYYGLLHILTPKHKEVRLFHREQPQSQDWFSNTLIYILLLTN